MKIVKTLSFNEREVKYTPNILYRYLYKKFPIILNFDYAEPVDKMKMDFSLSKEAVIMCLKPSKKYLFEYFILLDKKDRHSLKYLDKFMDIVSRYGLYKGNIKYISLNSIIHSSISKGVLERL